MKEYLSPLVVIGLSGLVLGEEGMKAMGAMDTEAMYSAPEAPRYEAVQAASAVGDSLDQVMFAEGEAESDRLERDLGIGHAPLHHPVHHAPVHHFPVHHAPVHHAPVHHAPLHHAPAPYAPVHHAPVHHKAPAPYAPPKPVHHAPAYEGHPRPYQYNYGVSDAYSGSQFTEAQAQDEKGVVVGSYSVALPDGRLQVVKYTADPYGGYVAEVSYEGQAVYPEIVPHHKPGPGYHGPAPVPHAPVYKPRPHYAGSEPEPVYVAAPEEAARVAHVAVEAELPVYQSKIKNVGY